MEELRGDQATWQFDGTTIRIRYHAGWTKNELLKRLGRGELPLSAVSAVELQPPEKRRRWRLHLWASDPNQLGEELPAGAIGATGPVDPDSQVVYERIRQLGRLHTEGILTDQEFATKKAELLDRL